MECGFNTQNLGTAVFRGVFVVRPVARGTRCRVSGERLSSDEPTRFRKQQGRSRPTVVRWLELFLVVGTCVKERRSYTLF